MTNRQIIASLISQGVDVSYYVRKDGSIRVTSLNGVSYSSRLSKGNEAARLLYFERSGLSKQEAAKQVEAQLKPIKAQRFAAQRTREGGRTLSSQSQEFQAEFKKLQRRVKALSRANKKAGKRGFDAITWQGTKEASGALGISPEAQLRRLQDYYEPLASDVAPRVMVQGLIDRIKEIKPKHFYLEDMYQYLNANKEIQDVYAIDKASNVIYEIVQSENFTENAQKASEMLDELKAKAHIKQ